MEPFRRVLSLLLIFVSLLLLAIVVAVLVVPSLVVWLPWAGVLAGLMAVLHALNLLQAPLGARVALAVAGLGSIGFMVLVLAVKG